MDKIDKKLIGLLQENAWYSLKHLAEQVYLSSPAVSSRMERLEKEVILPVTAPLSMNRSWGILSRHISALNFA